MPPPPHPESRDSCPAGHGCLQTWHRPAALAPAVKTKVQMEQQKVLSTFWSSLISTARVGRPYPGTSLRVCPCWKPLPLYLGRDVGSAVTFPKSFAEQSRERAKATWSTRCISKAPAVPPWPLRAPGGRRAGQHPCALTSHWTLRAVPSHCSQGVQLLGIGTFCVLKDHACTVNSEGSVVRRPMFQMSKVVADEYNLRHTKEDVPGKKTG